MLELQISVVIRSKVVINTEAEKLRAREMDFETFVTRQSPRRSDIVVLVPQVF